jgi:hypothetical protein
MKYLSESDDHWRRAKRSLFWTVVLLAVLSVTVAVL